VLLVNAHKKTGYDLHTSFTLSTWGLVVRFSEVWISNPGQTGRDMRGNFTISGRSRSEEKSRREEYALGDSA
jgi:hypothetical protein